MASYYQPFPENPVAYADFVPITVAGAVADLHRIPIHLQLLTVLIYFILLNLFILNAITS